MDDDRIDEDEIRELNEFLYGKADNKLPENIKKQMDDILQEEMPFEKVWPFIENKDGKVLVDEEGREIICEMLYDVAESNKDFHEKKKEFIMKYEAGIKRLV